MFIIKFLINFVIFLDFQHFIRFDFLLQISFLQILPILSNNLLKHFRCFKSTIYTFIFCCNIILHPPLKMQENSIFIHPFWSNSIHSLKLMRIIVTTIIYRTKNWCPWGAEKWGWQFNCQANQGVPGRWALWDLGGQDSPCVPHCWQERNIPPGGRRGKLGTQVIRPGDWEFSCRNILHWPRDKLWSEQQNNHRIT